MRPSAKALGKRKVTEPAEGERELHFHLDYISSEWERVNDNVCVVGPFDPDDLFYDQSVNESTRNSDDSDSDDGHAKNPWHRPVHYVYDAAAERTEQRIREGRLAAAALVAGVH